jgi:putative flippase GtrA
MQQIQRRRQARESLPLTFLIYCLVGMFAALVLVSPLTQWLGNLPALGNSRLGMAGLMVLTMTIPGTVAGGVTARFSPRWCLVPWAVVNTWYFLFRMLPELRGTWKDGAWQFWMLAVACAVGFVLQTWVLFATRRRAYLSASRGE